MNAVELANNNFGAAVVIRKVTKLKPVFGLLMIEKSGLIGDSIWDAFKYQCDENV